MNRRGYLLGAIGTIGVIAGYNRITGSTSEATGTPTADCADQIHPSSEFVSTENDIVVGPLVFANVIGRPFPASRSDHSDYTFFKTRIVLESGAVVTLVVPKSDRDHVALDYGFDSSGDEQSVRFEACGSHRTQWAGGLLVTSPRCVTLDVQVKGEEHPREVSIPVGVENCDQ